MKISDLDPKDMVLFANVVETHSLSAASRLTLRPKATISRAIVRLEKQLGARLLERSVRQVTVTEAGRVVYGYAVKVAQAVEDAEIAVSALNGQVQGTLRIGCSLTLGKILLKPLVPAFAACHPDLQVQVELTNRTIDLLEEGFDVILKIGPLEDSSLIAKELACLSYGVFASPNYLRSLPPVLIPSDLVNRAVIDNFCGKKQNIWDFSRGDQKISVKVFPRFDFNDAIMRRDALINGAGIGMVPHHLCMEYLKSGALVQLLDQWTSLRWARIYVVWPSRLYLTPKVRAFLDYVSMHIAELIPHSTSNSDLNSDSYS